MTVQQSQQQVASATTHAPQTTSAAAGVQDLVGNSAVQTAVPELDPTLAAEASTWYGKIEAARTGITKSETAAKSAATAISGADEAGLATHGGSSSSSASGVESTLSAGAKWMDDLLADHPEADGTPSHLDLAESLFNVDTALATAGPVILAAFTLPSAATAAPAAAAPGAASAAAPGTAAPAAAPAAGATSGTGNTVISPSITAAATAITPAVQKGAAIKAKASGLAGKSGKELLDGAYGLKTDVDAADLSMKAYLRGLLDGASLDADALKLVDGDPAPLTDKLNAAMAPTEMPVVLAEENTETTATASQEKTEDGRKGAAEATRTTTLTQGDDKTTTALKGTATGEYGKDGVKADVGGSYDRTVEEGKDKTTSKVTAKAGYDSAKGANADARVSAGTSTEKDGRTESTSGQFGGSLAVDKDLGVTGGVDGALTSTSAYKDEETGIEAGKTVKLDGGLTVGDKDTTLKGGFSADSTLKDKDTGSGTTHTAADVTWKDGKDGSYSVAGKGERASTDVKVLEDGSTITKSSDVKGGLTVGEDAKGQRTVDASGKYVGGRTTVDEDGSTSVASTTVDGSYTSKPEGGSTVAIGGGRSTSVVSTLPDGSAVTDARDTTARGTVTTDKDGKRTWELGASTTGTDKITEKDGKVSIGDTTTLAGSVVVGPDGDKVNASYANAKEKVLEDGTRTTSAGDAKATYATDKDGKVSVGASGGFGTTSARTDADGDTTSSSSQGTLGVGAKADGSWSIDASGTRTTAQGTNFKDGSTTAQDASTSGKVAVKTDAKGQTTVDASGSRASSTTLTDKADGSKLAESSKTDVGFLTGADGTRASGTYTSGSEIVRADGATSTSSGTYGASFGTDKDGNATAGLNAKGSGTNAYKDADTGIASTSTASAEGSFAMSKDKTSFTGALDVARSATDDEGKSNAAATKVGGTFLQTKEGTTLGGNASHSRTEGFEDAKTGVSGSTTRSIEGGVLTGPDKTSIDAGFGGTKKLGDADTGSASTTIKGTGGVVLDSKTGTETYKAGGAWEGRQELKDDGTSSTRKVDGGVSFDSKGGFGANAGYGRTDEVVTKDADGKEQKTASGATASATFGQAADGTITAGAAGGLSRSETKADGSKESRSVDGSLTVLGGPGKEGIQASLGVGYNGARIAVNGGYSVVFQPPVQKGTTWIVSWVSSYGAGASATLGGDGKSVGASASGEKKTFGAKSFSDEAAAKSFFDHGEVPELTMPTDADAALKLKEGEVIGVGDSGALGLGGALSAGGVAGSLGGSVHTGSSLAVTARGDGVVEVAAMNSSGKSGNAGLSGGVAGVTFGSGTARSASRVVSFDLKTEEGKAAYAAFLADPQQVPKKGAKELSANLKSSESDDFGISLLAAGITERQNFEEEVVQTEEGRTEKRTGTHSGGVNLGPLGKSSHTTSLTATQDDKGQTSYAARTDIDDTYATDVNRGLAKATNTTLDVDLRGKASGTGKWAVDTSFDTGHLEDFAKRVESGEFSAYRGNVGNEVRDDLRERLKEAGDDPDKREAALAKFVKEGGAWATSQIKAATGKDGEHHVTKEGDKNLTGFAGHQAMQAKIKAFRGRIYSVPADRALPGEVKSAIASEKERRRNIANPANYPELTTGLRNTELGYADANLADLEGILGNAQLNLEDEDRFAADDAAAVASPTSSGVPAKGTAPAQAQAPAQAPAADPDQAKRQSLQAALTRMEGVLRTNRAAMDASYTTARHHQKVHNGYYAQTASTAKEKFGGSTFGFWENTETASYGLAEKHYSEGQASLANGEKYQGKYEKADTSTLAGLQTALDEANAAAGAYRTAQQSFDRSSAEYQSIRARNADVPGLWDGYNHALKPGE